MKRGSVVLVAIRGSYGKPRPCVVVQTDEEALSFDSITVCPMTTFGDRPHFLRPAVMPSAGNGLDAISHVQIEKVITVSRAHVGSVIGSLSIEDMVQVDVGLATHLGLLASIPADL